MTEEKVSVELFKAATADDGVEVLCWQSVDGKNYFAADIKLRLSTGERVEPDLILRTSTGLWLIEVKRNHAETLDDERKLVALLEDLGEAEITNQIYKRAGIASADPRPVLLAVAYGEESGSLGSACEPLVHHICWESIAERVGQDGIGGALHDLVGDPPPH